MLLLFRKKCFKTHLISAMPLKKEDAVSIFRKKMYLCALINGVEHPKI